MYTRTVLPRPVAPKLMPKIDRYAPALFSPPELGPELTSVYKTSGAPAMTCVGLTVMENAGSEALAVPSLTEMTMLEVVPALAAAGVPLSLPVEVLNVAHEGPLLIENVKAAPLPPAALGVNAYARPAVTLLAGLPVMVSLL